jgi:5S rRNA maturation endonuclease (ribonuclease M5)|tara:strand:- start:400 stop:816 length:417 start_codon:yes stop_codon:yes gene_type:complete
MLMNILQKNIEFNKFLVDFIDILNLECENGAVVLVEGKKDTQALSSLGFVGKTIEYCNNNNISKIERKTKSYNKVIVLFDYDAEGRRLTSKILLTLDRTSLIELKYRRNLSFASNGGIRRIEELSKLSPYVILTDNFI